MTQLTIIVNGNTATIPHGITKKSIADFCKSSNCHLRREEKESGTVITRTPSKEKLRLSAHELFWELGEHFNTVATVKEVES